ncbi:MAG: Crp/Fnr family transcriptional regulator [Pseudomonadota bacterium]
MNETGARAVPTARAAARRFLVDNTFLGGLPGTLTDRLMALGALRNPGKGEMLFQQEDAGESLIVILAGTVKVTRFTAEGRELVLNFLKAGDIIGEIAVLDGGPRTAGATMLEPGAIFVIQRRDLVPVLLAAPEALMEVVGVLCEKLRATSDIVQTQHLDLVGRFAAGVLRLAALHGRRGSRGVEVDLAASQQDLGAYLGMSRENASRLIARLGREGVLSSERRLLILHDMERLQALADQGAV